MANNQVYKGLFLSYFVLVGLAAHFNMTSSVCLELEVDGEPCGALVIAMVGVRLLLPSILCDLTFVQAERTFKFWITGVSTAGILDCKMQNSRGQLGRQHCGLHQVCQQIDTKTMEEDKRCCNRADGETKTIGFTHSRCQRLSPRCARIFV